MGWFFLVLVLWSIGESLSSIAYELRRIRCAMDEGKPGEVELKIIGGEK